MALLLEAIGFSAAVDSFGNVHGAILGGVLVPLLQTMGTAFMPFASV